MSPKVKYSGFTLVELVIALAVLAILMAVAIPSYRNYVVQTNRTIATAALNDTAQRLERCYTRFSAYNNAACTVAFPIQTEGEWYVVTGVVDATTFTLTATPQGSQATSDTECGAFTLTHTGVRGAVGDDCW